MVLSYGDKTSQPPLIFTFAGDYKQISCFQRDEKSETKDACQVNWQNKVHLFGGSSYYTGRQISRLDGLKLERIGSLTFQHGVGGCSILKDQIFLCFNMFDSRDMNRCRRATGPLASFTEVKLSYKLHPGMPISASESESTK